ncbi:MAG TPA: arylesterase [Burkholderiales bacterium]|nr:arylesterase [Burkholderiales bacterium]
MTGARSLKIVSYLLGCAALAAAAAVHAATILVLGDSLSAGYGLAREKAWASLLAERLRAEGFDYKVVNASVSGETTLGGANRIEAALRQHRPAIVILALGANDGLRGMSLEAMRSNLAAIVDACRRARARVLLVGMRLPPNYGNPYAEKFARVYAELAAARALPLVPFLLDGFAEKREYFQPDGIHPTAEAQPLILETVWKELRPLLEKKASGKR